MFSFTSRTGKTPPALLPQQSRRDHPTQQRAGAVLVVAEPLMQHLHDRQAGVEADEVRKLQ